MATWNASIEFPNASGAQLLAAGELVAEKKYGWKPQIEDPENPGEMIDNPVDAKTYMEGIMKKLLTDNYRQIIREQVLEDSQSTIDTQAAIME